MLTQSNSGAVVFSLKMAARLIGYLFQKRRFSRPRLVSYAKSVNSFGYLALSINQKCYFDAWIISLKSRTRFSLAPELLGSIVPKLIFDSKSISFQKFNIDRNYFFHVYGVLFMIYGRSTHNFTATTFWSLKYDFILRIFKSEEILLFVVNCFFVPFDLAWYDITLRAFPPVTRLTSLAALSFEIFSLIRFGLNIHEVV